MANCRSSKRTPVSASGTQAPECRSSSSLPGSSTWKPWAQPSGISKALAAPGESSTACHWPQVWAKAGSWAWGGLQWAQI